jgi:hypothetical protein
MNDIIFALALLSMSAPETPIDPFTVSCYQEILRNQAIADEILDENEAYNYLRLRKRTQSRYDEDKGEYIAEEELNWEEQKNDLHAIQSRYSEMYSTPHLGERWRFPQSDCIIEMQQINGGYGSYLSNILFMGYNPNQGRIRQAIIENDIIGEILGQLRIIQREFTSTWQKRRALARLKELLGDENFYEGWLPPPVPLWYSETIK